MNAPFLDILRLNEHDQNTDKLSVKSSRHQNPISLIFAFACLLLFSCERAVEKTSVAIQLPGVSQAQSSGFVADLLSTAAATTNVTSQSVGDRWMDETPSGFSGFFAFNCYVVMVAEPEDQKKHTCYGGSKALSAEGSIYQYSSISKPMAPMIGSTIYVDVNPGENRRFYLFGMHANNRGDCAQFRSTNMEFRQLTRPYLIAKSIGVSVGAGTTTFLNMTAALPSANDFIERCDWTDVATTTVAEAPAKYTEVQMDTGIFGGNFYTKCVPIDLAYFDDVGITKVFNTYPSGGSLSRYTGSLDRQVYYNPTDCANATNAVTVFSYQGQYRLRLWTAGEFDLSSSSTGARLSPSSEATVIANAVTPRMMSTDTFRSSGTQVFTVAQVPPVIKSGDCVPITYGRRSLDWSVSDNLSAQAMKVIAGISGGQTIAFYQAATCTGGAPTNSSVAGNQMTITPSSYYLNRFYIKYGGLSNGGTLPLTFEFGSPTDSSTYISKTVFSIFSATAQVPVALKITGPDYFYSGVMSGQRCLGPFKIALVGEYGSELADPSKSYDVQMNAISGQIDLFAANPATAPCAGGPLGGVTLGSTSSILFYVKAAAATIPLNQFIYASSAGLARAVFPLQFDMDSTIQRPVMPAPVDCNLTGTCGSFSP